MTKQEAILNILNDKYPHLIKGRFSKGNLSKVLGQHKYSLKELGYAYPSGASRACKRIFPDKPPNTKLCTYILGLAELKCCYSCRIVKPLVEHNNKQCKKCDSNYNKEYLKNNLESQSHRSALRRARELQATPAWADIGKIKLFYLNRPEGHHVDHIYPLVNSAFCGLHTIDNLQYLTAENNLKKSNKDPSVL